MNFKKSPLVLAMSLTFLSASNVATADLNGMFIHDYDNAETIVKPAPKPEPTEQEMAQAAANVALGLNIDGTPIHRHSDTPERGEWKELTPYEHRRLPDPKEVTLAQLNKRIREINFFETNRIFLNWQIDNEEAIEKLEGETDQAWKERMVTNASEYFENLHEDERIYVHWRHTNNESYELFRPNYANLTLMKEKRYAADEVNTKLTEEQIKVVYYAHNLVQGWTLVRPDFDADTYDPQKEYEEALVVSAKRIKSQWILRNKNDNALREGETEYERLVRVQARMRKDVQELRDDEKIIEQWAEENAPEHAIQATTDFRTPQQIAYDEANPPPLPEPEIDPDKPGNGDTTAGTDPDGTTDPDETIDPNAPPEMTQDQQTETIHSLVLSDVDQTESLKNIVAENRRQDIAIDATQNAIDDVIGKNNEQDGRLSTAERTIAGLTGGVDLIEMSDELKSVAADVETHGVAINGLDSRISTVEQDLGNLQDSNSELNAKVSQLERGGIPGNGTGTDTTQIEADVSANLRKIELNEAKHQINTFDIELSEDNIESNDTDIAALDTRVTTLENSGGNGTGTDTTQIEADITTNATNILDVSNALNNVKDTANAAKEKADALDTRVTTLENSGGSGGNGGTGETVDTSAIEADITQLKADIVRTDQHDGVQNTRLNHIDDEQDDMDAEIAALDTRVDNLVLGSGEGGSVELSEKITEQDTRIDNMEVTISGSAEDIVKIGESITGILNKNTNQDSKISAVETTATSNTQSIAGNTASITSNTTSIAGNTTKITGNTSNITGLTGDVNGNAAGISTNFDDIATNKAAISTNSNDIATVASELIVTNANVQTVADFSEDIADYAEATRASLINTNGRVTANAADIIEINTTISKISVGSNLDVIKNTEEISATNAYLGILPDNEQSDKPDMLYTHAAEKSIHLGAGAQVGDHDTQKTGMTSVGSYSRADGDKSTAVGADSHANGANSVAIGSESVANEDNTVSFGNDYKPAVPPLASIGGNVALPAHPEVAANTRRLTHISNGINANDAVNMQQLNNVSGRISGVEKLSLNGIAISMATKVILPDPGKKFRINFGVANYEGANAFGITGAGRLTNSTALYFGLGTDTDGDHAGMQAGASYQW